MSEWNVETLKEYVDERFRSVQEAISKADAAFEKRMDNTNEWRSALDKLTTNFVTKESMRWALGSLIAGATLAVGYVELIG